MKNHHKVSSKKYLKQKTKNKKLKRKINKLNAKLEEIECPQTKIRRTDTTFSVPDTTFSVPDTTFGKTNDIYDAWSWNPWSLNQTTDKNYDHFGNHDNQTFAKLANLNREKENNGAKSSDLTKHYDEFVNIGLG